MYNRTVLFWLFFNQNCRKICVAPYSKILETNPLFIGFLNFENAENPFCQSSTQKWPHHNNIPNQLWPVTEIHRRRCHPVIYDKILNIGRIFSDFPRFIGMNMRVNDNCFSRCLKFLYLKKKEIISNWNCRLMVIE